MSGLKRMSAYRLNAISPYFTMFPLDYPLPILGQADQGDWVLDPFSGRGTTLFAARVLGLPAVGVDTSAVAVATSRAKLVRAEPADVIGLAEELVSQNSNDVPDGEFWNLCYSPVTLRALTNIRDALLVQRPTPTVTMLRAIVLGALHGPLRKGAPSFLSNQMPRTYASKPAPAVAYWRSRNLSPPNVDVLDVIRRRVAHVLEDQPQAVEGDVLLGDARVVLHTLERRFRWVITSPPYVGMRTYVPDQWLRNWFLGGPPTVQYEDVHAIRSADPETFATQLGEVLRGVANVCVPGAHLHLRFGAIPSCPVDPGTLLKESLRRADIGWEIRAISPAGLPKRGMRQADQMGAKSAAIEEVDCEARLDS